MYRRDHHIEGSGRLLDRVVSSDEQSGDSSRYLNPKQQQQRQAKPSQQGDVRIQPPGTHAHGNGQQGDDHGDRDVGVQRPRPPSDKCLRRSIKPMARIIAQASAAQAPEWFTTAPNKAIRKVLDKAGLSTGDIDLYEINEAFSVVSLANNELLVEVQDDTFASGNVGLLAASYEEGTLIVHFDNVQVRALALES